MSQKKLMKISELGEKTGAAASTIRFYVKQGLLREPIRKGRTVAYYSPLHVEQLKYILALKKKNKFTLHEIKQRVADKFKDTPDDDPGRPFIGKQEEIIRASVDLFLNKGYHDTTITDIVDNAGIGRGTFYAYFANKEELFWECADKLFKDLDTHFNIIKNEGDVLSRLKRRAYEFLLTFPTLINLINIIRGAAVSDSEIFKEKLNIMMRQLVAPIVNDLDIGMRNNEIRDTDSTVLGHILMGAAEYISYYAYELEFNLDNDRFLALFQEGWDMIYYGAQKD